MNLTFAGELTKMIDSGLGRETVAPDTSVAVGRYSEYVEVADAALATFDTNAALPLRALTVDIEPIQEGTGDPSPENVRPISGRSEVGVTRTGKNLFDIATYPLTTGYISGGNGGVVTSGVTDFACTADFIPVSDYAGKTVTLNKRPGGNLPGMAFYSTQSYDTGFISAVKNSGGAAGTAWTFTIPQNANYIRFTVPISATDIQIEFGSSATTYEPYQTPQNIIISLGSTVYGGTVDAVSGVMTVDRAMVDLGTLNYYYQSNNNRFTSQTQLENAKYPSDDNTPFNAVCSALTIVSANQTTGTGVTYGVAIGSTDSTLRIRYAGITDMAEFKTAMNGVQLCYELAQPVTVQLTAQQLTTLLGTNNVWSDGGNVSLTYTKYNYTEGY